MRMRYQFPGLTDEERLFMEFLLVDQVYRQKWYTIVHLELWKSEGLLSIQ